MQTFNKRIDELNAIKEELQDAIKYPCSSETHNIIFAQIKKPENHIEYLKGITK